MIGPMEVQRLTCGYSFPKLNSERMFPPFSAGKASEYKITIP